MSYQVLARKYRPQRFSDVIGQDHVTRTLQNAIEQQRIAHGYIFSGHRGIGKTTIARILAMALNCRKHERPTAEPCGECDSCSEVRAGNAVDVIEIDAATNRGIDEIRELREAARYRPARDRFKIYILDEAHQITDAAFNALLKTLEEPPNHIVFMMATTQPEDIPQTIRSRCQHFSFHAVKFDDIVGQIKAIAKQEGVTIDDQAVAVLAEAGDGSMRDALSIMDQAIACTGIGEALSGKQVLGLVGSVSSEVLENLMGAVANGSSQQSLEIIDRLVTEGQSPTHFVKQLVRFLRNAMVSKVAGAESQLLQISSDERQRVGRIAAQFAEEDLTRFLQIALRTHDDLGYKQEQRFHLELGVLKMVHAQRLLPLEQLLSQQPVPAANRAPAMPAAPVRRETPAVSAASSGSASEGSRPAAPSPFEADRSRKSRGPEMSGGPAAATAANDPARNATITATAIAAAVVVAKAEAGRAEEATPPAAPAAPAAPDQEVERWKGAILAELESAGQGMLVTMLDEGDWSLSGHEIVVKVARSAVMIEMSYGAEARKLVTAAATRAAGSIMRMKVEPGGPAKAAESHRSTARPNVSGGPSARNRAADDPLVRYAQEKFKGEIRTVIDQSEKK